MASRFDKDTIREYFEEAQRTGKKRVGSISALTDHAHKTASNDEEIRAWLFPPEAMVVCPTCQGKGRIPQAVQEPEVCFNCKGVRELIRLNPATGEDETWPCSVCEKERFAQAERERGRPLPAPVIQFKPGKAMVGFADLKIITGAEAEAEQPGENLPG
jgi:DnaJ-class molecular chaperone